jgi:hypothetical protein
VKEPGEASVWVGVGSELCLDCEGAVITGWLVREVIGEDADSVPGDQVELVSFSLG